MYGLHIALPNFSHCMTPAAVVCIMYSTEGRLHPACIGQLTFFLSPFRKLQAFRKRGLDYPWLAALFTVFCSNIRRADGAGSIAEHAIGSIFHLQMVLAPSQ